MIKRVALITFIAFILLIMSAKAATLTGNVHFVVNDANGTNLNYKLYNVTSTTGSITLFNGGISTLDNNGGGTWKRVDVFPFSAAALSDGQYCIQINGAWVNVTNSTGALKASLYDPLFWDYVSSTGDDIRFANQTSQLYFWIQDFNATAQTATIWVNLTAGSTELRLYYGNSLALQSSYNNASRAVVFYSDGSLTGWTSVNVIEDTTDGNPPPSLKAAGGTYAYIDAHLDVTKDYVIRYDVNVIPGTNDLCNLYFFVNSTGYGQMFRTDARAAYPSGFASTTSFSTWGAPAGTTLANVVAGTWLTVQIVTHGTYATATVSGLTGEANNTLVKAGPYIAVHGDSSIVTGGLFDNILITYAYDPATFGTPTAKNTTTVNATASINSVSLVAPALNLTVPSQTFTLPALSSSNWFNFSAESGDFSANVSFSFTSTFTQNVTANFTELVVSSDVYVPANCTSNNLTIEFNTSIVPAGVVIYSYNLSVLVNGTQVNFTKTATENLNVWYFTISLNNLSQGWHSVKVLLVYQPAYLNITVYDANNVTSLLDKTLNVTVYDQNFNILSSATVNGTANISVVFAGKVFVRISNSLGVARQLEATITPGNTTYLTFYFPSANVVIATLQFLDYTNSFSNATVIIKRYISRNVIVPVDVQKMTAQMQTSHYLIANVPYEVYVTNGVDTRDLGYISLAYSQTLQLVIGNILNVQAYPYVGVAFNISTTNETIEITYKTIKGTTSSVDVVITNSTGYVVYNTTLTTPEGKVTYLITNPNETYYVSFHAENSFEPVSYRTVVTASGVQFEPVLPVVAGGTTLAITAQSLPLWARLLFFGGLGIFVALLFKRSHVAIGLTMSLAVLIVFTLMGVLPLQTNTLWVLALIVMVAWFVWWRERR